LLQLNLRAACIPSRCLKKSDDYLYEFYRKLSILFGQQVLGGQQRMGMKGFNSAATFVLIFLLAAAADAWAGDQELEDLNGDGNISYLAFGDSITAGLGDGYQPGAEIPAFEGARAGPGYPARISQWAHIVSYNAGVPGEELAEGGFKRFPGVVSRSPADLVGILEGANDAIHLLDAGVYRRLMQRLINVAQSLGRRPIVITIPTPCCNHAGQGPFTRSYGGMLRDLALLNSVPIADVEHAWDTTCENREECELFNLPEGLHPNSKGYDVIAQTILATLYGIDIFSPGGAKELEGALGLPAGSVVVKPDQTK
jgi:lysophospholipase L1-like esterase